MATAARSTTAPTEDPPFAHLTTPIPRRPAADYAAPNTPGPQTMEVALQLLAPSTYNPRRTFDEEALRGLADSILKHGLLQPIVVRPLPLDSGSTFRRTLPDGTDGPAQEYEVVAGERRYRAAAIANLPTVPVRVLHLTDREALELAIVENLQRADLDPIEQAEGYKALADHAGMRQGEIALAVKVSQPTIARAIGLLSLPPDVQELIRGGHLSPSHGEVLGRYRDYPRLLRALAADAVANKRPVRELEGALADHPLRYDLVRDGIVKDLSPHTVLFDTGVCAACPFDARRAGSSSAGICLKPSHYDELQRAAAEARAAATRAAVTEAKAAGTSLPTLSSLGYGTFERIGHGHGLPPAGCTEACPCRAAGLDYDGKPSPICTDVRRFKGLQVAESRASGKVRRATVLADRERLAARLDGLERATSRELAIVAHNAFEHVSVEVMRAAVARRAPQLEVHTTSLTDRIPRWELAKLDETTLMRLALDVLLNIDLNVRVEMDARAIVYDWYMDGTIAPGGAHQPHCTVCHTPLEVPPGTVLGRYICASCEPAHAAAGGSDDAV